MRLNVLILVAGVVSAIGCAASPKIGEVAVTTPDRYSENKVLFAADADPATPETRDLLHAYEIVSDDPGELTSDPRYLKRLDPLGVIVRGVRMPDDGSSRKDIAVVIDIVTAGEESVTSLVVFYQRNVPGGQMLNFKDLLVYYDPEWDGVTPPWFRVRVLEVNAERNQRTRAFLTEAGKLSGSLAGIVPHPVLPSVSVAIEAAKLVLGNRRNKVLIDYQVQFYSPAQILGAGGVPLSPLRKGEWLVIGRPRGETSKFWNNKLEVNLRTDQLHVAAPPAPAPAPEGTAAEELDTVIEVPYVSVVLMVADASVPKHILDRSAALLQLLDSPTERVNFDSLAAAGEQLTSALVAYKTERMLKKYRTKADFTKLIEQLEKNEAAKNNKRPLLLETHERSLVKLGNDLAGTQFGTAAALIKWFREAGGAGGDFDADGNWVVPPS